MKTVYRSTDHYMDCQIYNATTEWCNNVITDMFLIHTASQLQRTCHRMTFLCSLAVVSFVRIIILEVIFWTNICIKAA